MMVKEKTKAVFFGRLLIIDPEELYSSEDKNENMYLYAIWLNRLDKEYGRHIIEKMDIILQDMHDDTYLVLKNADSEKVNFIVSKKEVTKAMLKG